ncbi:hypothetical protein, partial [Pseudobacillus badius]|uniref:hypothetical protein n=1 Tax=Bacillus badius TaxID=1455 RepID=UPI000B66CF17
NFRNKRMARKQPILVAQFLINKWLTFQLRNTFFRLTYLSNPLVETYDSIESVLSAIEKVMENNLQETSN